MSGTGNNSQTGGQTGQTGSQTGGQTGKGNDCVMEDFEKLMEKEFKVTSADYTENSKDPIVNCQQCCKQRAQKWNTHCEQKHRAIERVLKKHGCEGTIHPVTKKCGVTNKKSCCKPCNCR